MRLLKLSAIAVAGFLAVAQAYQIDRSNPPVEADVIAPPQVKNVMERSCYGCHSNETVWPWYSAVAPVSWLLAYDVHEGRAETQLFALGEIHPDTAAEEAQGNPRDGRQGRDAPLVLHLSNASRRQAFRIGPSVTRRVGCGPIAGGILTAFSAL